MYRAIKTRILPRIVRRIIMAKHDVRINVKITERECSPIDRSESVDDKLSFDRLSDAIKETMGGS